MSFRTNQTAFKNADRKEKRIFKRDKHFIKNKQVKTSFVQGVTFQKRYRTYLLMPLAIAV